MEYIGIHVANPDFTAVLCIFVSAGYTPGWLIVLPCLLDNNAPLPEVRKKYHLYMTCQLLPKSESMFELGWALRHLSYSYCRVLHGCYEVSAALRRGLGSDNSRLANCITTFLSKVSMGPPFDAPR